MRKTSALIFVLLASTAFANEWEAVGRIGDLAVEFSENGVPTVFMDFFVGKNRPILCVITGPGAMELYEYWQYDCRRVKITGKLRITKFRTYIRIADWKIMCK